MQALIKTDYHFKNQKSYYDSEKYFIYKVFRGLKK